VLPADLGSGVWKALAGSKKGVASLVMQPPLSRPSTPCMAGGRVGVRGIFEKNGVRQCRRAQGRTADVLIPHIKWKTLRPGCMSLTYARCSLDGSCLQGLDCLPLPFGHALFVKAVGGRFSFQPGKGRPKKRPRLGGAEKFGARAAGAPARPAPKGVFMEACPRHAGRAYASPPRRGQVGPMNLAPVCIEAWRRL
jgi:hypothetical protein